MCLQLPHQLFVDDPLAERQDDDGRQDAEYSVAHLAETLDILSQCFALALANVEKVASRSRLGERSEKLVTNCWHS